MKRTQIYLDEEQDRELGRRSRATGVTKSALIRRAIREYLRPEDDGDRRLARFRRAVRETAGCASRLPDGATYVERLRGADLRRQRELDERRER